MSHHAFNPEHLGLTRREFLNRCGVGFGSLGLAALLGGEGVAPRANAADGLSPMAPRAPHFPAKAKRVIHLFMNGGPSQVDTFDPKPSLDKYHGQKPAAAGLKTERNTGGLSSLVSLWNTAKTMRPFRRKAAEQEPPGQPADRILGLEEIKEQATSPNDLAVFEPGKGPREPDRPTPGPPARPNSSRRPEPKPVPAPGGTEEPVGWLRSLGNRMRPKK